MIARENADGMNADQAIILLCLQLFPYADTQAVHDDQRAESLGGYEWRSGLGGGKRRFSIRGTPSPRCIGESGSFVFALIVREYRAGIAIEG